MDDSDFKTVIDLRTQALDLGVRLGSITSFLAAARELLTCSILSPAEFNKDARKIIALIEISRATLKNAGILLYQFTSCSSRLLPHKVVYFKLLHMLAKRQQCVGTNLRERLTRLLFPLSTNFVIHRVADLSSSMTLGSSATSHSAPFGLTTTAPLTRVTQLNPDTGSHTPSMPPPDYFTDSSRKASQPRRRGIIGRIWGRDPALSKHSRSRKDLETEQENTLPLKFHLRPRLHQFGIFCTGKSSMHQLRGRPKHPSTARRRPE